MDYSNAVAVTDPSRLIWLGRAFNWIPKELSQFIGSSGWFQQRRICEIRNAWGTNMVIRREEFLE